ncbi:hypothetical protein [Marinoscillum pacificum]|nr:hypothetical protein [Marinoscillum pacificum]
MSADNPIIMEALVVELVTFSSAEDLPFSFKARLFNRILEDDNPNYSAN